MRTYRNQNHLINRNTDPFEKVANVYDKQSISNRENETVPLKIPTLSKSAEYDIISYIKKNAEQFSKEAAPRFLQNYLDNLSGRNVEQIKSKISNNDRLRTDEYNSAFESLRNQEETFREVQDLYDEAVEDPLFDRDRIDELKDNVEREKVYFNNVAGRLDELNDAQSAERANETNVLNNALRQSSDTRFNTWATGLGLNAVGAGAGALAVNNPERDPTGTAVGAGVGALTGGVLGGALSRGRWTNPGQITSAIMAPIGALGGAGIGAAIGGSAKKDEVPDFSNENIPKLAAASPFDIFNNTKTYIRTKFGFSEDLAHELSSGVLNKAEAIADEYGHDVAEVVQGIVDHMNPDEVQSRIGVQPYKNMSREELQEHVKERLIASLQLSNFEADRVKMNVIQQARNLSTTFRNVDLAYIADAIVNVLDEHGDPSIVYNISSSSRLIEEVKQHLNVQ